MQSKANDIRMIPLAYDQSNTSAFQPNWPQVENQGLPTPTKSLIEAHNRKAAIESIGILTVSAKTIAASIRQHGLETYDNAVHQMLNHRNKERTPEHQALVEEYLSHELMSLRRDLAAIEMVGITSIAQQIQHSHQAQE